MKKWIIGLVALLFWVGCKNEDPVEPDNPYEFVVPSHFPPPTYTFQNNPVTEAGFKLGKKLFNEPILSIDNTISCASCHQKSVAFTDPQHRLSLGVEDRAGTRNAPQIANMAFMKEFLWDGGVVHLDFLPPFAIENELEMDETLLHVVQKLNAHEEYPTLFREAFGDIDSINAPLMQHAFAQYMNLLVSSSSKYDDYYLGQGNLSANELEGLRLFEENCATCHSGVLFTDQDFHNNGLDTVFTDIGRELISEWEGDRGKFKTPSLRNIALTSPYMHDGRLKDLDAVLDHYRFGVVDSETLADELKQNGPLGIPLNDEEKARIIDFLHTLTDYEFVSNPIF
jgi:cytochrome c peroxidase